MQDEIIFFKVKCGKKVSNCTLHFRDNHVYLFLEHVSAMYPDETAINILTIWFKHADIVNGYRPYRMNKRDKDRILQLITAGAI